MASGVIVLGFLLMLLLPCAITLFSGREGDAQDASADVDCEMDPGQRHISKQLAPRVMVCYETQTPQIPIIKPRTPSTQPAIQAAPIQRLQPKQTAAPAQLSVPVVPRREMARWHETTAPFVPVEPTRTRNPLVASRLWADNFASEQTLPVRRQKRVEEDWLEREEAMARVPRMQRSRLEMAELDVLRARAIAVRAHAEALAAVARAARAKAEAAAEEAVEAEYEARNMGRYVRRAA